MNYELRKIIKALMIVLVATFALHAQTGKVSGRVTDAETGDPLPGANIVIRGDNPVGTATNLDGEFILSGAPVGTQLMNVTYIGYKQKTIEVNVERNQIVSVNIELNHQSLKGEDVVVTAQARGQTEAMNQQISNEVVSNVVSSSEIQELPEANAAEAIGRLPGVSVKRSSGEGNQVVIRGLQPKLNLVTVNGIRMPSTNEDNNAVGLAGASQYMLDGIEVRKSLTAQDPGDVVGGIVDLKLATADEGFHMNVVADGLYNGLNNSFGSYRTSLQVSNRFFDNSLGVIAQVNAENIDRTRERYSANFGRDTRTGEVVGVKLNGGSFAHHDIMRGRYGANLIMDYILPAGKIQFNSVYNEFEEDRWERNLNYGIEAQNTLTRTHNSVITNRTTFVNSLKLETDIFNFAKFDFGASYTKGDRETPEENWIKFTYNGGSPVDPALAQDPFGKTGYKVIPALQYRSEEFILNGLHQTDTYFEQTEKMVYSDLTIPFSLRKMYGSFKFGYKARFKDRLYDLNRDGPESIHGSDDVIRTAILKQNPDYNWPYSWQNRPAGEHLPAYPLFSDWSQKILEDKLMLDEYANRETVDQIVNSMEAINWSNISHHLSQPMDTYRDYEGEEERQAGYVMTELNWEKWLILNLGVRYEKQESVYSGFGVKEEANVRYIEPDSLSDVPRENEFWMPRANMKIKYLDWADIRLAYSKSVARPDYYSFMPRYRLDLRENAYHPIGNTDLKPSISQNYDLIFSFYSNYVGMFSVGGFYKEIDDFYYVRGFEVIDPEVANSLHNYENLYIPKGRRFSIWYNSPKTSTVRGIEYSLKTSFWYLPKPLNGLVMDINYSMMDSKSQYYLSEVNQYKPDPDKPWIIEETRIDSFETRRMIDQPDNIFNIRLGYDYKDFSIRAAYSFQGTTLAGKGEKEADDIYTHNYKRWDISIKQELPIEGLSIKLMLNNITAEPDEQYQYKEKFNTYEEYYGWRSVLGIQYRL